VQNPAVDRHPARSNVTRKRRTSFVYSTLAQLSEFHPIKFGANFPSALVAHRKVSACS